MTRARRYRPLPPASTAELVERCIGIAGRTVGEVAALYRVSVPPDLKYARGFIGRLLEQALGADHRARNAPDFPALRVELKSIPIDPRGRPRQPTRVCQVPTLRRGHAEYWEQSLLRSKLACILWIPVQSERHQPITHHRIGGPLLRRLPAHEETVLRADWEECMALLGTGQAEQLGADVGQYLQVRAASRAGARNFYLRTRYTERILREPPP